MDNIKMLIETTQLTLAMIATQQGCSMKRVRKVWVTYSKEYRSTRKTATYSNSKQSTLNPMTGKFLTEHHNYIGAVSDGKGYLMVVKPVWYTGRKGSKHVFQHQVVICEYLGITAIPKGWCVHHCDENPHNNRFDNLVLLSTRDHMRLHNSLVGATTISKESTLKWVEAHGTPFQV